MFSSYIDNKARRAAEAGAVAYDTPDFSDVKEFVGRCNAVYAGNLTDLYNYSRVVSLAWFEKIVRANALVEQSQVVVVSGGRQEPELKLLKAEEVGCLRFEEDERYNLDVDWSANPPALASFVMCNQVLEHVGDPYQAFRNIVSCTRVGGHMFVSVPTINCIHGEPYFYSSGFHPRFLRRLALENGLDIVGIGAWGSPKYMLNAVNGRWLTYKELRRGYHGIQDTQFPSLMLSDGRKSDCAIAKRLRFSSPITDCWGLFRRAA